MSASYVRLAIVLVCIAGLSAAQNWGGSFTSCPSPQSSSDNYFAAQNCAGYNYCATNRCNCQGGSYSNTTQICTVSTTGKACSDAKPCQASFITCLQQQANTQTCLNPLKVAVVNVLAGTPYTGSALDLACRASTCQYFNVTAATNCTISYPDLCFLAGAVSLSPLVSKYLGQLLLNGGYAAILADPSKLAILINAINLDLSTKLQVGCNVTSTSGGSLVAIFTANAASTDPTIAANVAAAAANGNWLTNTAAQFSALGGTGQFGLLSLGAAGAASVALAWSALFAVLLAIFA